MSPYEESMNVYLQNLGYAPTTANAIIKNAVRLCPCPRGQSGKNIFTGTDKDIQKCREVNCPYLKYVDGIYGCMKDEEELE